MIIHSIQANNVLKYQQLDLQDLPAQGVIAISGLNESGKSTIGETICFALFGRTFSIDESDLAKILRWGASDCSVTIQFSQPDSSDERYAITRMLDCDGNHSAKLYQVYNEDNPIARGINRVAEALFSLTSIEFEEFVESFYLAQREITTPHPHSYALKTMAGVATMEYCDQGIHEDINQDKQAIEDLGQQISTIDDEINSLNIDSERLASITEQYNEAELAKEKNALEQESYQTAIEQYNEAGPQLKRYLSKKSRATFWRFSYFIIAIACFSLWWLLVKMPDSELHHTVTTMINNNLLPINTQYITYLLYAGAASTLFFLIFWAIGSSHTGHIKRLQQWGIDLAQSMRALDDKRQLSADEQRNIHTNAIHSSQLSEAQLTTVCAPALDFFNQQEQQLVQHVEELSEAVRVESERVNLTNELQAKTAALAAQQEEKQARNRLRELASELLSGASRHLSKRFNHILRDHVGKTLPLFTENRYEHLQIDDDLSVRVFSNEKHDFLELDEISSGTQRQIMLAVRLALSQEMVSRKVQNKQFLILDEPFAFFDQERTERSLSVLPQLSSDLPQIWIIAQSFPQDMDFEYTILCERDELIQQAETSL